MKNYVYKELPKTKNSNNKNIPFNIGDKLFIRTITHYYTGKLKKVVGKFWVLDECAWIADTGRFMGAVKMGTFSEIEPMGDGVAVNSEAIIDAKKVNFKLPNTQK